MKNVIVASIAALTLVACGTREEAVEVVETPVELDADTESSVEVVAENDSTAVE